MCVLGRRLRYCHPPDLPYSTVESGVIIGLRGTFGREVPCLPMITNQSRMNRAPETAR